MWPLRPRPLTDATTSAVRGSAVLRAALARYMVAVIGELGELGHPTVTTRLADPGRPLAASLTVDPPVTTGAYGWAAVLAGWNAATGWCAVRVDLDTPHTTRHFLPQDHVPGPAAVAMFLATVIEADPDTGVDHLRPRHTPPPHRVPPRRVVPGPVPRCADAVTAGVIDLLGQLTAVTAMIGITDSAQADADLAVGRVACPACAGRCNPGDTPGSVQCATTAPPP